MLSKDLDQEDSLEGNRYCTRLSAGVLQEKAENAERRVRLLPSYVATLDPCRSAIFSQWRRSNESFKFALRNKVFLDAFEALLKHHGFVLSGPSVQDGSGVVLETGAELVG